MSDQQTELEQITQLANYLLAEKQCAQIDPQKYVDWAVLLLQKGFDTENIRILAGLDHESQVEIEDYFWKCVEDLNLNLQKTDAELLTDFAIYTARAVLTNDLEPKDALRIMVGLVIKTDYIGRYIQFFNLAEDIERLEYDGRTLTNSFDSSTDLDELIREEFRLFLEAEKMNLDDKFRDFAYCNQCQKVDQPILKRQKKWFKESGYQYWVCRHCASRDLEHFSDQKGKRIILNHLQPEN